MTTEIKEPQQNQRRWSKGQNRLFTPDEVRYYRPLYARQEMSLNAIQLATGVSLPSVRRMLLGETYKDVE